MTEDKISIDAQEKTRQYFEPSNPSIDPPRITLNPDVWLQETIAILSETSIEMVALMAKNPAEIEPFMRVFALVTTLAADSKKMLQQGNGQKPPVAPPDLTEDNDDMEARIAKLEDFAQDTRDRLTRIESRLDNFPTIFSTKEDLHKELHAMTWRIFGACAGLVAAVYFIAKYVTA